MIGVFKTIKIDNNEIYRPSDFELKRSDVYAGEYTNMYGATRADRVAWKYADTSLKWDTLPDSMLSILINLTGAATLEFEDSDGTHTEQFIRGGFSNTATRYTAPDGSALWRDVEMDIKFINSHPINESE